MKTARKAGDKTAFTKDQAALKLLQEDIKQDRQKIQQILKANGKGKQASLPLSPGCSDARAGRGRDVNAGTPAGRWPALVISCGM